MSEIVFGAVVLITSGIALLVVEADVRYFVISTCRLHSYCVRYEETRLAVGECANCGCHVGSHTIADHDHLPSTSVTGAPHLQQESNTANETKTLWSDVAKAAKLERQKMQKTCPPVRKAHGGKRVDSGRKKAVYRKDVQICPVRIKNRALGTFSSCGKRIYVSLKGQPVSLKTLEDASLKACFGIDREEAIRFDIDFFMLKTLKGPRLEQDEHVNGTSFYLYCSTSDDAEELQNDSHTSQLSMDSFLGSSSMSAPVSEKGQPKDSQTSRDNLVASSSTSVSVSANGQPSTAPSRSQSLLSVRTRNLFLNSLRTAAAPARPPTDPSKILGLGKSLALPAPFSQGWATHSLELFHFLVEDDWSKVHIKGPESSILNIEGYPGNPFAEGAFQLAYKARCVSKCDALGLHDTLVFKQHKIEEYGFTREQENITDDAIHNINIKNQKSTAKEAQIAAVASALCYHFNEDCALIPDYGRRISIVPCYHVKLTSVVCPSWGILESFLETTKSPWLKFINNDGIPVGEYGPAAAWPPHVKEFQQKAESFSHWSFQKFKGKAFVCDLQGADFKLTDVEIASTDNSLFGLGNLSTVALNNFRCYHKCNVYCAALGLQDIMPSAEQTEGDTSSHDEAACGSIRDSVRVTDGEVSFYLDSAQQVEGEMSHLQQTDNLQKVKAEDVPAPEGNNICKICLQQTANSVFYDCGHTYACFPCAEKCAELSSKCPVCRKEIKDVVRLVF